jgi:hypothetical protein
MRRALSLDELLGDNLLALVDYQHMGSAGHTWVICTHDDLGKLPWCSFESPTAGREVPCSWNKKGVLLNFSILDTGQVDITATWSLVCIPAKAAVTLWDLIRKD